MRLVADWREREDPIITLVDFLSKAGPSKAEMEQAIQSFCLKDQEACDVDLNPAAEWSIHQDSFRIIWQWAFDRISEPSVDLFATSANRKARRFCSRFLAKDSLGNAFAFDWSGKQRLYAFPPWSQIPDIVEKIKASKDFSLLLVVKYDRSAPYWPLLTTSPFAKKKRVFCGRDLKLVSSSGKIASPFFDLCAFVFGD